MKVKSVTLLIVVLLFQVCLHSQEKSSKELKKEKKLEQQKQTEELVNSRTFVFTGTMAYPQGGRSINLSSRPNFVKFSPELIDCDMPFFGRAYSVAGYGGSSDGGYTFSGAPDEFIVDKTKKGFSVRAKVKGNNESYDIAISLGSEGSGTLTISSVSKSTMSYSGNISKPEGTK